MLIFKSLKSVIYIHAFGNERAWRQHLVKLEVRAVEGEYEILQRYGALYFLVIIVENGVGVVKF